MVIISIIEDHKKTSSYIYTTKYYSKRFMMDPSFAFCSYYPDIYQQSYTNPASSPYSTAYVAQDSNDYQAIFPNRYTESSQLMKSSKRTASPSDGKAPKKPRVYQRYPKPPYSYVGMIITAIETRPDKSITLSELTASLKVMFDFFRGPYTGWKDSIRHTLSSSPCFIKTEEKRKTTCLWIADLTTAPSNVFKRQDTRVKDEKESWAPTLHEQLNIPEIVLPSAECRLLATDFHDTSSVIKPVIHKSPDFNFSIDNILTNVDRPSVENDDDSRRRLSFSTDSPVFTTKSIKLRRNAKKSTHKQLSKLIAEQSAAWGISQDQAIENLSFLCKSIPSALQQLSSTSSAPSPVATASSPDSYYLSSPLSVINSTDTVTSTYSPVTPTSPSNRSVSSNSASVSQHHSQPTFTMLQGPSFYQHDTSYAPSSFYAHQNQATFNYSDYHNAYHQQYTDFHSYHQAPAYHVDTSSQSIQPLNLSSTSLSSASSPSSSDTS
ncbi:uncharacterized protein LOC143078083 [Mytilus galloprovincialis]|uniref:uncharacterized protein LOC143078083 n=1 Tax=Mytilus galloprovincialis TaxID=29158 RepID=UPI003F7B668F